MKVWDGAVNHEQSGKVFSGPPRAVPRGASVMALALPPVSASGQSAETNCTVIATVPHDSDTDDRNIPDHAVEASGTEIACVPAIVPAVGTPTANPATPPKKPAVSAASEADQGTSDADSKK